VTATGYVSAASGAVEVAADGTIVGTRPEINVISGTNVTVSGADNSGANRVDLTLTSTAGGAGPASTVTDETTYGVAKAVGVSSAYARQDHTHGSPALTSSAPTSSAVGDSAAVGAGTAAARADHTHGREAFAAPAASAVGDTQSTGAATTLARSDHRHAREAFAIAGSSAVGDAAAAGTAATTAHSDHVHAREAFAAPGASAVGDSQGAGAAATVARSDHRHAREAFATPGSSAVGDSAAAGSAATVAHSDHTHGREAFGAVTAQTSYGASSANGSAATLARSDHTHGTPPNPYTVVAFNVPGTVAVAAGAARIYNDSGRTLTIQAVRSSVGTAPTGQALLVDINKNATTIFTTQGNRPSIAAAANTSGKVTNMDVTSWADGDYLTVDVDAVGSGTAGADLTVQIWVA
jgi:hypothetical protein